MVVGSARDLLWRRGSKTRGKQGPNGVGRTEEDSPLLTSGDEVEFTQAIPSSRMVSSLLKNHDRNLEAARRFQNWEKAFSIDSSGEPSVTILDSIHIDPKYHGSIPTVSAAKHSKPNFLQRRFGRRSSKERQKEEQREPVSRTPSIAVLMENLDSSAEVSPDEKSPSISSDIGSVNEGYYRKSTLGRLFRSRGKSVQRAKDQMTRGITDPPDSSNVCYTPRKLDSKIKSGSMEETIVFEPPTKSGSLSFKEELKQYKRAQSHKLEKSSSFATPGDTTRTGIENILSKIKRALDLDLSHELQPPLIHSFKNKMFAFRTPWHLPLKERSLRNNAQQVLSFLRVLERYVEDQVFRYGPAAHPRLEKVYTEIYTKMNQLYHKVSPKSVTTVAQLRRLAVVGDGLFDLGNHMKQGSPIYYQKFMVFDLSQDGSSFSNEHGDVFHNQVLHFPMNVRGLPCMRYLCSVSSAALFWLEFCNRDNLVIFNYSTLNYNILLTFACAVLSTQPSSTANEIDQVIINSFDWRRKCQTVSTKGTKPRQDSKHNSAISPMIPITRWPPSYKRYMSYFLSLYGTSVDYMLAQQFRLKSVTLVNCVIPGTEVILEIYQVGPDPTTGSGKNKSGSPDAGLECSRYSAIFYPKCACGGKEREGAMLMACPADYRATTKSSVSKSGKYGYVGEITFDFTTDSTGNQRDLVISGDIVISIAVVSRRQKKVIATYSFNSGFVNSELLEIPKAEFDIWDTSSAIQPQGQMTISMEVKQGSGSPKNHLVINSPTSDVGIFTRHHIVKVEESEVESLMKETSLSYVTCKFARKLCMTYSDALVMLNTLFKVKDGKFDVDRKVIRGPKDSGPEIPMVKSIDVPKPLDGTKPGADGFASRAEISGMGYDVSVSRSEVSSDSDPIAGIKTTLNLEQVDRLSMDPNGTMHILLVDGTKVPVPNNNIGTLFKMFGKPEDSGKLTERGTPMNDGAPDEKEGLTAFDSQQEDGHLVPEGTVSMSAKATMPPVFASKAVPTISKMAITKKVPPAVKAKVPPANVPPESSTTSKASKGKAVPVCVKKGGPSGKMKAPAPPPPLPSLKAKSAAKKAPPPLGVKLHWRPLNMNTVKGTIFETMPKPSPGNKMFDSTLAKQLFSKSTVKRQNTMKVADVQRKMLLEILDAKRAQNVGIILRFAREADLDDLIDCVDKLELGNPIVTLENVSKILTAYPQGPEMEGFREGISSGTDMSNYRDIERKIFKILAREQMENKAKVTNFALNYKHVLSGINDQLAVFENANQQVSTSEFLPMAMGIILQYGNYVNHGDDLEAQTLGFSLSSATKLIDIKSADNTLSSMHYLVVNMIVKYPECDFTKFDKGFNYVMEAEKICASGLDEMFDEIRDGLNFLMRLEEQLEPDSLFLKKVKELIKESTEDIGIATDNQKKVLESIKNTWRFLGEECKQGTPLEEIFKILGDFVRCIKKVVADIQQRPSKFIVAINDEEERQLYNSKFVRSRRR